MARLIRRHGTLIGFVAILIFFSVSLPDTFLTARNWLNISQQVSMLVVVAASMTIVMVMQDFDLSVGSMASRAGVVAAVLFTHDFPVYAAVAIALLVGLLGGVLNGVLVGLVGILPFIATLATLTVFSGAAFLISGGKTIFGRDIPEGFSGFARSGIPFGELNGAALKLPSLTIAALAVVVIVWVLLEHTKLGRRLYAIGSNPEAAWLSGINVKRLRLIAFALAGLGAAVAGLMYASRVASANPTQGSGLMLSAIAAVFLGMTMSEGGEPRVHATLIGVLILGTLDNGLTQLSVNSYVREVLVGAVIIAAVASSSLWKRVR